MGDRSLLGNPVYHNVNCVFFIPYIPTFEPCFTISSWVNLKNPKLETAARLAYPEFHSDPRPENPWIQAISGSSFGAFHSRGGTIIWAGGLREDPTKIDDDCGLALWETSIWWEANSNPPGTKHVSGPRLTSKSLNLGDETWHEWTSFPRRQMCSQFKDHCNKIHLLTPERVISFISYLDLSCNLQVSTIHG